MRVPTGGPPAVPLNLLRLAFEVTPSKVPAAASPSMFCPGAPISGLRA